MGHLPDDRPNPETDEDAQRLLESASLADELGVEVVFAPDSDAPPVDRRALAALVRGQLDDASARDVTHLIATYRVWHDAWRDVLRSEARRS